MDINLDYIRLKFPLRVELSGLSMIEATGDTLLSARQADLDVAFWPLFSGNISVTDAHLADASYRLNSPDSAAIPADMTYAKELTGNFSPPVTGNGAFLVYFNLSGGLYGLTANGDVTRKNYSLRRGRIYLICRN